MKDMKSSLLLLLALTPLCASAQGVVYVPTPPYPGQYPPFNQYGVTISANGGPDVREYSIDINGDGIVDYTLTATGDPGFGFFTIVPAGSNSVLAYVDQSGAAYAVNLGAGVILGQAMSLSPAIWASAGNSSAAILNYTLSDEVIGDYDLQYGTFANTTGFVGLQFWINNQAYYGFLQLDTRYSVNFGGLYQGYAWNTTPGGPITTTYFRERLYPPGPSIQYIAGPAFYAPINSDPVSLDMNTDGTADVSFSGEWLTTCDVPPSESSIICYVSGANGAQLLVTNGFAQVLAAGEWIGSSLSWSAGMTLLTAQNFNMRQGTSSGWLGPLGAMGHGYMGIQFLAHDGTHYGWIQVRVSQPALPEGPQVVDWAYQTVPDKPILAGERPVYFEATFTGTNEVPPNESAHSGTGKFTLEGDTLNYSYMVDSSFQFTAAGIFGPATPREISSHLIADLGSGRFFNVLSASLPPVGPAPLDLNPFPSMPGTFFYTGQITLSSNEIAQLSQGRFYVNFESAAFPRGELRGKIWASAPIQFSATLSGRNEIHRHGGAFHGTGKFTLTGNKLAYSVALDASFVPTSAGIYRPADPRSNQRNLVSNLDISTGVLIPSGGVAGQPGLPGQVLYTGVVSLADREVWQLKRGELYVNFLTAQNPHGELRGQILPVCGEDGAGRESAAGRVGPDQSGID